MKLRELVEKWPETLSFSMAPFGYVVEAHKYEQTETGVIYCCTKCDFEVSVDPRDMDITFVKGLFRHHVDQAH